MTVRMTEYGLKIPDDDSARIWRYIKLEHLEDMLQNRALRFARADTVDDTNEGQLPESIKMMLKPILADIYRDDTEHPSEYFMEREERALQQYKLAIFLNCWHLDENESLQRWQQHRDRGIAIQSTYHKLDQSSWDRMRKKFSISMVNYIDHKTDDVSNRHSFTLYVQKDLRHKHENELRAIRFDPNQSNNEGLRVPVDPEALLERIVIAPTATQQIRDQVFAMPKRLGLNIPVVDSKFR